MKKSLFTTLSLCLVSLSGHTAELSCNQDYPEMISQDLNIMATELKHNDYSFLAKKTHPSVINFSGGEEAYQQLLEFTKGLFNYAKIEVTNVESKPPLYSYQVNNEEICFIPKPVSMKIAEKPQQASPSFMVAIRSLQSHEWSYIDGAGFEKNPQLLYQLFPDFPKNADVPFKTNVVK